MKLIRGNNIVFEDGIHKGCIIIEGGIIRKIFKETTLPNDIKETVNFDEVIDAGDLVLMPGVVDSHVHVNEPGRTEWEGFYTATKAAASGGVTSFVDMPLNSIPSTTSVSALETKKLHAKGKCFVDVGFWGGVVPGNQDELLPMIDHGVCGFKCFMIHSGVEDFPAVDESDMRKALTILQKTSSVLMFHAEVDSCTPSETGDGHKYETFLQSRPGSMENNAIDLVCKLCEEYSAHCHIVHLSSAEALPIINHTKKSGRQLTVETTHHYLSLAAEEIPDKATQYKCCPPIRDAANQEKLWDAVKTGDIDLVVSDHSPCTEDLKDLGSGDFMAAWGGISSLQFGLPLFWTGARKRNISIPTLVTLMCKNTAKLAGLDHKKGKIEVGYDADFVIWDPNEKFEIQKKNIQHKNKLTPYLGSEFFGVVHKTILRGDIIYDNGVLLCQPMGEFLEPHHDRKRHDEMSA